MSKRRTKSNGPCRTHDDYRAGYLKPDTVKLWCCLCNDYVTLGPARDTPDTAIEVRAAEIAWADVQLTDYVYDGWQAHRFGTDYFTGDPPSMRGRWDTGYLARAIATHDEEA